MVTLQNCDSEPIHIPGAIQPSGALVAVDGVGLLAYASSNTQAVLDMILVLGEALRLDQFDASTQSRLQSGIADPQGDFEPCMLERGGQAYDVIGHLNDEDC